MNKQATISDLDNNLAAGSGTHKPITRDIVIPDEFGEEVVKSPKPAGQKLSFFERIEVAISRLSAKNNFWYRVCSLIWLPYAFRSGILMKREGPSTFSAVLPFRRANKNWYNAMAGAALLGNSEIAGGMYVFGICGGDYAVVCKQLQYKFLRPCLGPALYRITAREDIQELLKTKQEFNITLDMQILQLAVKPREKGRERRVGRCDITFHVTPKAHLRARQLRRENV
jgi:hypothetical protein